MRTTPEIMDLGSKKKKMSMLFWIRRDEITRSWKMDRYQSYFFENFCLFQFFSSHYYPTDRLIKLAQRSTSWFPSESRSILFGRIGPTDRSELGNESTTGIPRFRARKISRDYVLVG